MVVALETEVSTPAEFQAAIKGRDGRHFSGLYLSYRLIMMFWKQLDAGLRSRYPVGKENLYGYY
ncbi:MAG: hypothetical protein AMR96_03565 [Candidatus Adiutrix intracellularis]|nr:MAG: hypothetical protein AMR96_03565 [Candidatus Adiutrix intracellularis]